nr:hypothetical protein [Tanacetum cinerariifolium]
MKFIQAEVECSSSPIFTSSCICPIGHIISSLNPIKGVVAGTNWFLIFGWSLLKQCSYNISEADTPSTYMQCIQWSLISASMIIGPSVPSSSPRGGKRISGLGEKLYVILCLATLSQGWTIRMANALSFPEVSPFFAALDGRPSNHTLAFHVSVELNMRHQLWLSERADTLFPLLPNLLNISPSFSLNFFLRDLDRSRLILENTLGLGLGLRERLDLCLFRVPWYSSSLTQILVTILLEGCIGRGPSSVLWSWLFSSLDRISHDGRGPARSGLFMIAHDTLLAESSISGDKGLFFNTAGVNFSFSPILKPYWYETTPLKFSRFNPLIGVFKNGFCLDCGNRSGFGLDFDLELSVLRIIVVGGVRFIGGLVDMEDNLGVEIYDGDLNSWEICPPLPADFRSGNSSQSLCSGLFKERFYVFGIYSGFVSSFDLEKRVWSDVQTLRPPGVVMSCLISCGRELMLAGLCNDVRGHRFNLWRVDELTMEFSVVAIMPSGLLNCLFDSDGDDQFASLKCVGYGNFIFVFNEEHRRNYPACVCEIRPESGEYRWRRVPDLPEPVNRFHKVIGFCSTIPIHRILGDFIVERPEEDSPNTPMEEEGELPEPWILFTDESSCTDSSGAGLILTNPEGMEFTYALRFGFDATKNEAGYEALIVGLRIAEQMGVKNLQANVDP